MTYLRTQLRVYSLGEAKRRAARYCAYQERSQYETHQKLRSWGLSSDEADEVIAWLIEENFINEERFAKAYAGGKFRIKSWGRVKIMAGLKKHQISPYCVRSALSEIDEAAYLQTLKHLGQTKMNQLAAEAPLQRKRKVYDYLLGKGFESQLIQELLHQTD